jgi:hypothetical protein
MSLFETVESASAVSLKLLKPLPQSHWYSGSQTYKKMLKITFLGRKYDLDVLIKASTVSSRLQNPLRWSH